MSNHRSAYLLTNSPQRILNRPIIQPLDNDHQPALLANIFSRLLLVLNYCAGGGGGGGARYGDETSGCDDSMPVGGGGGGSVL